MPPHLSLNFTYVYAFFNCFVRVTLLPFNTNKIIIICKYYMSLLLALHILFICTLFIRPCHYLSSLFCHVIRQIILPVTFCFSFIITLFFFSFYYFFYHHFSFWPSSQVTVYHSYYFHYLQYPSPSTFPVLSESPSCHLSYFRF